MERVHVAENVALLRHGPFCSSKIHSNAGKNSLEDIENMEAMAEDVREYVSSARFGNSLIKFFRGVATNLVFDKNSKNSTFENGCLNINRHSNMNLHAHLNLNN